MTMWRWIEITSFPKNDIHDYLASPVLKTNKLSAQSSKTDQLVYNFSIQLQSQRICGYSQGEKVEKLKHRKCRSANEQAQQSSRLSQKFNKSKWLRTALTDELVVVEPEAQTSFIFMSAN
jgi:hypothetical protein